MASKDISGFKILQWNCRSINKNYNNLLQFLSEHNINILSLQSLNSTIINLPHIPNFYYPPVTNTCKNSPKVYTAIYIRLNIPFSAIPTPVPDTIDNTYSCAITTKINNLKCSVLSVYLPKGPTKTDTSWLKDLVNLPNKDPLIICGDFNAHSTLWEENGNSVTCNKFVDNLIDSPLCILNDGQPTRIPDNLNHKPTAIDLTLVSPNLAPITSWSPWPDPLNSDHLPIILTLNFNSKPSKPNKNTVSTPSFIYSKANWEKFSLVLFNNNIDFKYFSSLSPDNMYSYICELIISAAKLTIPQVDTAHTKKHSGNPWWSSDCEIARKNKWSLYKHYLKHPSPDNLLKAKQAKNLANRTINHAKQTYWENLVKDTDISSNIQQLWSKIKHIKCGISLPDYPIHLNNNNLPSDIDKANAFVDQFALNGTLNGLSDINSLHRTTFEQTHPLPNFHEFPNTQSDYSTLITLDELNTHLLDLNQKKTSSGLDGITNKMIKSLPPQIIELLLILFNTCLSSGSLPDLWKKSIIIPIHKQGKPTHDINSYRPIALTSNVCKLFEKIILSRLTFFCTKNKIIPLNQSGFQKGRSTTEHLIKLTTHIKHQFSRRKNILATFFDVKKAFDQVWHHRLLQKLAQIKLDKNLLLVIQNFLSNRTIQVKINTTYSTSKKLHMGVPQGSVLSPILFNIFLYDLPSVISKNTDLTQFADDICMWQKITLKRSTPLKAIQKIQTNYQNELNKINNYISENGLTLSSEKTKLILFNNGPNSNLLPKFTLCDSPLPYSHSTSFLGITLTSKLNWSPHFENIINKGKSSLNLLKTIASHKWGKNTSSLRTLALALVRSKLTYAQEVFFTAPDYLLNKLQSLDCKAFKISLGVPYHTNNLNTYNEINIPPLHLYRKAQTAKFVIKSIAQNISCSKEMTITSENSYPKRGKHIKSLQPIRSYTNDLLHTFQFKEENVSPIVINTTVPPWIIHKPKITLDYLDVHKSLNPSLIKKLS